MRLRAAFSICIVLAAGCGRTPLDLGPGDTPDATHASGLSCTTSLRCPSGERCDDGGCVTDDRCPTPFAPKRVPASNPPLYSTNGIFLFDGDEHVVASDAAFNLVLVRLSDSRVLTISRPAECSASMLYFDNGPFRIFCHTAVGHSVFVGLDEQGATLTPTGVVAITLLPGEDVWSIGFPSPERALVGTSTELRLLTLLTGEAGKLAPLDGRAFWSTIGNDAVISTSKEGGDTVVWLLRPNPSAVWQRLGSLPFDPVYLLPLADSFYAVDTFQGPRRVYRLASGAAQYVGTAAADVVLPSGNDGSDQPNGHLRFDCEDTVHCALYRSDLDPPASKVLAKVDLPTTDLVGTIYQRTLACSGVEAFIVTLHQQIGTWPTLAYYLVRVVPQ